MPFRVKTKIVHCVLTIKLNMCKYSMCNILCFNNSWHMFNIAFIDNDICMFDSGLTFLFSCFFFSHFMSDISSTLITSDHLLNLKVSNL